MMGPEMSLGDIIIDHPPGKTRGIHTVTASMRSQKWQIHIFLPFEGKVSSVRLIFECRMSTTFQPRCQMSDRKIGQCQVLEKPPSWVLHVILDAPTNMIYRAHEDINPFFPSDTDIPTRNNVGRHRHSELVVRHLTLHSARHKTLSLSSRHSDPPSWALSMLRWIWPKAIVEDP